MVGVYLIVENDVVDQATTRRKPLALAMGIAV